MSPSTPQNYYKVLGLNHNFTDLDLKAAYRRIALIHHPDKNKGNTESTEKFKLLQNTYETLKDPARRAQYDTESEREARNQPSQKPQRRPSNSYEPKTQPQHYTNAWRSKPTHSERFAAFAVITNLYSYKEEAEKARKVLNDWWELANESTTYGQRLAALQQREYDSCIREVESHQCSLRREFTNFEFGGRVSVAEIDTEVSRLVEQAWRGMEKMRKMMKEMEEEIQRVRKKREALQEWKEEGLDFFLAMKL